LVNRADVARLAGVSPAVVSYVLNNSHPVSPPTRQRVEAAIAELDYRPNALARSLATARSHTIGLLLPDSSNSYFAQLAASVEDAALAAGFVVLLGNGADSAERELGYIRTFLDRQVDGLIVVFGDEFDEGWRSISSARIPAVSLDRLAHDLDVPSVVVDNIEGGRVGTQHLIQHGRSHIACITGSEGLSPARDRAAGWRLAMEQAALTPSQDLLVHGSFSVENGYTTTLELLRSHPEIDGIFAASDLQAVGVLRALADLGLRPGDDVAVLSFDGTKLSGYTTPRLSTVTQPYVLLAAEAVRLLTMLIEDPSRDRSDMHRVLQTTLEPRGTCGCPEVATPA